jgi:hypothetical protein
MKTFIEYLNEAAKKPKEKEEELSPFQKAVAHGEKKNYRWAYHHIRKHKTGVNTAQDKDAAKLAYNLHVKMGKAKLSD